MRYCPFIILATILIFGCSTAADAQILWRSAKTISAGSFIAMTSGNLTSYNRSYDWGSESWVDFGEGRSMSSSGFETMLGFGVTNRIEAMVHLPVLYKKNEVGGVESRSSGLGDFYLKTRIAIAPWTKNKAGYTLVGAMRFGSGDTDVTPALGDGTTDFAVAGIFTTRWMGKWRAHIKCNVWLNGKTDADVNVGDEIKCIGKLDHNFSVKMMGFLTYIYNGQGKQKDATGNLVEHSQKSRHYGVVGFLYKPVKGLFIRPKVTIPVAGKGGSLFTIKPLIDAWFIFKLI